MKWLTQLLSGKDNQTPDIARHSWVWCLAAVFASTIWNAMHAVVIDLASLAQAIAAVVVAHGGAIGVKSWTKSEPEPKE